MTNPLLALVLLASQDQSALLSPIERGVLGCAQVSDGAARLACYDRTARPLREMVAGGAIAAPAPSPLSSAAPSSTDLPPRSGTEASPYAATTRPAPTRPATPTATASRSDALPSGAAIADIRFAPRGELVVTLENGQVWRQLSSDSTEIKERQADELQTATVKRGALGSRRMRLEPLGKTIKVRADR